MSCERVWAGACFLRACGVRPACLVGARGRGRVWLRVAGRERGLVCAGRVDKWKGREREPVVWFSPRFFFFLCGADDGT